eukprot:GEMP01005213.1.p1 GENE.GEMP01005213.1~~GEMP01005213.1.p1  ORF type:complete len:791 (+),score=138.71 GEMP01005213.1:580-2952(+)
MKTDERRGLTGMVCEVVFFAYVHVHYQRTYEQYVGSTRDSFAFGWFLLCACIRSLILSMPVKPGFNGAQPGPPGTKERCYDEKAARILVCLVVTVICANDRTVKFASDGVGENSNGNKGSLAPSREREIATQIIGDLDGSIAFDLRRRFSDFLDEKFESRSDQKRRAVDECDTAWSLKPWNVKALEKDLDLSIMEVDLWLLESDWDEDLFWHLMLPMKEKFTRAPLEWHYIPTRPLVPLSYVGPALLPHDTSTKTASVTRSPSQPHEASVLSFFADSFMEGVPASPLNKKKQTGAAGGYEAKPVISMRAQDCHLGVWMNEVYMYPNTFPELPKKRKRNEPPQNASGYSIDAELHKTMLLFQKPLGVSNRDMKPIKQLFIKMKELLQTKDITKEELPYMLLACVEAWCFVSEIFPPTAPPECVGGGMAKLRRSLLCHRIVFFELLLALKLDAVQYWLLLTERFIPCMANSIPRRLMVHFEDCADELVCRIMWLSGSSLFVKIATFEEITAQKKKVSEDLWEVLDRIFHALLVRGGKAILDVSELHRIPYMVRYAAFDLFRHCLIRLSDTLLKDRHLDVLVICSIHLAAKIFKEDHFKLNMLADTCTALRPHLSQLWHQTIWRNIPLVCKPFQLHYLFLKQDPAEHGDVMEFHNNIFTTATRTMCCALTRLSHPNSHMRSIQEVAVEISLLAPYAAGRMTRASPHKITSSLLIRFRRVSPASLIEHTLDVESLQSEVLGSLGTLPCSRLPDVAGPSSRHSVTHFSWFPGLTLSLDPLSRRYKICSLEPRHTM